LTVEGPRACDLADVPPFRRPLEANPGPAAPQRPPGRPVEGPPAHDRRHPVGAVRRRPLSQPACGVRPLASVYDRFRNWAGRGLWDGILRHLQARKMRAGDIDWSLFCLDGTVVRAHQSAAGAAQKKARPASRTTTPGPQPRGLRHQAASDLRRRRHAAGVGPGQQHETQQAIPLLEEAKAWPEQPDEVAEDTAYSAGWLTERGTTPVIAHQKNEKGRRGRFDRKAYRRRNIVERSVYSLKWFRRAATRYEKLATHCLAMVTVAIIFRLLG
jgi:transposase